MIDRLQQIRPALLSLALIGVASAPALADALSNGDVYVRDTYVTTTVQPGYGFNGAYQEMRREMAAQPTYVAPTYVTPGYTYTPDRYVYSAPVTTYTYEYRTVPTTPTVVATPALSKNRIKDRLDDQGYDDIKVGDYDNGFYNVFAEDRDDRKVLLKVDASNGYVASVQYLR
jgi:hypothetical protein